MKWLFDDWDSDDSLVLFCIILPVIGFVVLLVLLLLFL